ncbi:potassium channel SKOR-like [Dorcoceras hygrometricum]|uniref:Potassium channel n=1 Tax=Dorcoceras hygrometricum TaxID=472368 RepID=A0A2Z7CHE9_9LAMI|nr:potassium channel SKOR-like [Dorcoceras hygrometricum]
MQKSRSKAREEDESVEYIKESKQSGRKNPFSFLRNSCFSGQDFIDNSNSNASSTDVSLASGGRGNHTSPGYIIHPENWLYVAWKQFILIWAVYSSFFTPLEFAFFRGLPENLFLLDGAGQIAFFLDIFVCFFLAYRDPHSYCMVYNHNLIAIRYLKSRFLIDLLGCFPWDAIFKGCGRKEIVRYMLWIRLSRALRVTDFFGNMEKNIRINYMFTRIVKLFVVELYCTHTAACIFYYLATTLPPSEEGYTWIGSLKLGDYSYTHFREIDLWTRYVTALYFAVVTMATVGYGDIHAVNTREMIFVMLYVSLDMILGAYLLGNMTALIVKGSKTVRFRDKMGELIKYMNRNKLGKSLNKAIRGHVLLQFQSSYAEVAALQDLPLAIRAKISEKIYEPQVRQVPLFKGCSYGFIKKIAIRIHEEFFLPGEVIIEEGNIGDQLYILCDGKLCAVRNSEDSYTEEYVPSIHSYCAFGEISVLCNIPEPHTIQAVELSKLLRIEKKVLLDAIDMHFSDGHTITNNLLEGKESNIQKKILESDIKLQIGKHESELATRLNWAANDGDLRRLIQLVEAGADPCKTDYDGRSPLHLASSKGYKDIIHFLIQKGVEVNVRDHLGKTPLYEAIKNGHDQVASLLVKAGAFVSVGNAGNCLCEVVASKHTDFLRGLLENGVNPNSRNYDLRTPLHLAASEGLYSESLLLLESGASVFAIDRWGKTPIDEARVSGSRIVLKLLEDAMVSQTLETSSFCEPSQDKIPRRKCTVFAGTPSDHRDGRSFGVVLWVPKTIQELVETAATQLGFMGATCILSENEGKITDAGMISDDQKLFLAREAKFT